MVRKIAGNRAAIAEELSANRAQVLFEGLNEAAIVFADSKRVSDALVPVLKFAWCPFNG